MAGQGPHNGPHTVRLIPAHFGFSWSSRHEEREREREREREKEADELDRSDRRTEPDRMDSLVKTYFCHTTSHTVEVDGCVCTHGGEREAGTEGHGMGWWGSG